MKRAEGEVFNIIKAWKVAGKHKIDDIDLIDEVLDILEKQRLIYTLYKTIEWDEKWINENRGKYNEIKIKTMETALINSERNNELVLVLKEFNNLNIDVIILKGAYIKELYRNSDLRTMNDFDILVKKESLDLSNVILNSLGYRRVFGSGNNGIHYVYKKGDKFTIELHWKLINKSYFRGNTEFESEIWKRKEISKVQGIKCYKLSLELSILHLFIHKAIHMVYGGIGLRQLLDLVLVLEKYKDDINWSVLEFETKRAGIEKFSKITLALCSKYLEYELPYKLDSCYFEQKIIDGYLEEIFTKELNIKKDINKTIERELAYGKNKSLNENYIRFLFPNRDDIGERYMYARKYRYLLPIAWVHRLGLRLICKEYSVKNKFVFITQALKNANKKNKLFTKLEL